MYDRFGNRWQQNGPYSFLATFTGNNPGSPQNNNRIDGYTYDAAGNLRNDGTHSYTYDAENRLAKVDGGATANYYYDAEGRRVHNYMGGVLYDLGGHVFAEVVGGWNRGEVYAGNRHIATYAYSTEFFPHTDWLGTERARSNVSGTLGETCTSNPFGEALTCSSPDYSPMHFTGKERDSESGLDNFETRYFGSSLGRFMSPDAANIAGDLDESGNPQSWNPYAYVRNNPINAVDPNGEDCVYAGDFKNSGTVLVERGDHCSYASGSYVEGHIDENSFLYDQKNNQLTYNVSDTGASGVISVGPSNAGIGDSDRFAAVQMGVGLGEQGVNWALEVTASNAVGAVVGGVAGEAIGSALSKAASKLALKAAQQELKSLSPAQYKLLQAWLGKIKAGSPLTPPPPGLTREAMEAYLKVAKAYVEAGSTPGGMATQITRIRALESALGRP